MSGSFKQECDRCECEFNIPKDNECSMLNPIPIVKSIPSRCPFYKPVDIKELDGVIDSAPKSVSCYADGKKRLNQDIYCFLYDQGLMIKEVDEYLSKKGNFRLKWIISRRSFTAIEKRMIIDAVKEMKNRV